MRVHSTFNNTLSVHDKASKQALKGAKTQGNDKAKTAGAQSNLKEEGIPPRERLSRSQILERIKNKDLPKSEENAVKEEKAENKSQRHKNLARASWDRQDTSEEDIERLNKQAQDKAAKLSGQSASAGSIKVIKTEGEEGEDSEPVGDVGANKPDDPATRGKLKDLVSSGGFHFNEKERAALSQILEKE